MIIRLPCHGRGSDRKRRALEAAREVKHTGRNACLPTKPWAGDFGAPAWPGSLDPGLRIPRDKPPSLSNAECLVGSIQSAASISSAIASILVTLFQLRAVPVVFNNLSIEDQGSLDLPAPVGK